MRTRAVVATVLVLLAACSEPKVALSFGDVDALVQGNVVALPVSIEGEVQIVKADGDTSDTTGHFHVFIDGEPVPPGDAIPTNDRGVVHSADDPIVIWGLEPGEHRFTLVLGNGAHRRIDDYQDTTTVDVKGPSVRGTAAGDRGDDLTIDLQAWGVKIKAPDGNTSGDSGHFHVLLDPDSPPTPGEVIPAPKPNEIIHTTEDEVTLEGVGKGEHTIYVVLGDGEHKAFDPPVMDKLTVTVA